MVKNVNNLSHISCARAQSGENKHSSDELTPKRAHLLVRSEPLDKVCRDLSRYHPGLPQQEMIRTSHILPSFCSPSYPFTTFSLSDVLWDRFCPWPLLAKQIHAHWVQQSIDRSLTVTLLERWEMLFLDVTLSSSPFLHCDLLHYGHLTVFRSFHPPTLNSQSCVLFSHCQAFVVTRDYWRLREICRFSGHQVTSARAYVVLNPQLFALWEERLWSLVSPERAPRCHWCASAGHQLHVPARLFFHTRTAPASHTCTEAAADNHVRFSTDCRSRNKTRLKEQYAAAGWIWLKFPFDSTNCRQSLCLQIHVYVLCSYMTMATFDFFTTPLYR